MDVRNALALFSTVLVCLLFAEKLSSDSRQVVQQPHVTAFGVHGALKTRLAAAGCDQSLAAAPATAPAAAAPAVMPATAPAAVPLINLTPTDLDRGYFDYQPVVDEFARANYSVCLEPGAARTDECWPPLYKYVDCKALFSAYLHQMRTYTPVFPAPKEIPKGQEADYTLSKHISVHPWYIDQSDYKPDAQVPVWSQELVDKNKAAAKSRVASFGNYGAAIQGIYKSLDCHSVAGLQGAVFGSADPWIESVFLAWGAAKITTIEYRKTLSTSPEIDVITPDTWAERWLNGSIPAVDFAVSYSSLEHDGLGRYGDPMSAWGDVRAMERAACYIKPGGLLFLGVPLNSKDEIWFNAHRIYGPVRMPVLTANWKVLGVFDTSLAGTACTGTCGALWPHVKQHAISGRPEFQPVVVLQNQKVLPCRNA